MVKPHDDRFNAPPAIGKAPDDFLPDLKTDDPDFIEKLAKETGFKFTDETKAS